MYTNRNQNFMYTNCDLNDSSCTQILCFEIIICIHKILCLEITICVHKILCFEIIFRLRSVYINFYVLDKI